MIIAVITALATMQAAGGLDYLVTLAERIMRSHPQYITFIAPVVTYVLIFASGTTHVIYALLPVISEVSRKANIRPERPLSISVIAGFQGVVASPISAATVAMIGLLAVKGVSLPRMLAINSINLSWYSDRRVVSRVARKALERRSRLSISSRDHDRKVN